MASSFLSTIGTKPLLGQSGMLKKGLLLTAASILAALLRMVRNIVIARLVSVEDFGIASTFGIAMGLVETLTYIGLERMVVQAKDSHEPTLLATLNAVQAARGALVALVLFVTAGPTASLFGIPQVAWAFQVMAIIPLLAGLSHLDVIRVQREMRFLPFIQVELASLILSTVIAIPLAFWFGDYRVMLFALVVQEVVFVLASHAVAKSSYRWSWNREIVRRAFEFGWPLLLASTAAYFTIYGDRIIVGSLLGMTALGWFSAGNGMIMAASAVLSRTQVSLFLPQLSVAQDNAAEFRRVYLVVLQWGLATGVLLAVGVGTAGPTVLNLLYGTRYAPAASILTLLAVAQAFRSGSISTAVAAMSKADTGIPLIANIVRLVALPIAWLFAIHGAGVDAIVLIGVVGEALSFATSVYLVRQRFHLPLTGLGMPCVLTFSTLALACVSPYLSAGRYFYPISATLFVALLLTMWSMPAARQFGMSLFRKLSTPLSPSRPMNEEQR